METFSHMVVTLPIALGLFLLAAVLVVSSGVFLAKSGDVIADESGLGHVWVGSLLVAGATSLPELVTNISAVRLDAPSLAAGNIFGANMLNMATFSVLILALGGTAIFTKLMPLHKWVASVALIMTIIATIATFIGPTTKFFGLAPVGIIIIGAYVVSSRFLYQKSLDVNDDHVEILNDDEILEKNDSESLKKNWIIFGVSAAIIFIAAPLLAFSSDRIADITGISQGFVGVLAVAIVTTLPEFTSAVTSFRIGSPDLGVGALFGSNAFNVAALGVADLFYTQGSLFASLDSSHLVAGIFAILLMSLALIQLIQRRPMRIFSFKTPSPVALIVIYVVGLFLVFQLGLQV